MSYRWLTAWPWGDGLTQFSISEAIGEPFRLIRHRPLWVLLWGAPYTLCLAAILPMAAIVLADFPLGDASTLTDAESREQLGQIMALQLMSVLLNVVQICGGVLVWGAINRAVLSGRAPDRWAHFRLSMDELHLLVIGALLVIGLYVGLAVVVILALIVGMGVFGNGGEPTPAFFLGLLGLCAALLIATLVMAARTCLIAPASIQLRRLALPEGWRLARGQTPRLVGLLALIVLIHVIFYLLTVGLLVAIVAVIAMVGGPWDASGAQTLGEVLPAPAVLLAWAALAAAPVSFVMGCFMALYVAPVAHAFRQLWTSRSRGGPDPLHSTLAESEPVA